MFKERKVKLTSSEPEDLSPKETAGCISIILSKTDYLLQHIEKSGLLISEIPYLGLPLPAFLQTPVMELPQTTLSEVYSVI